jgi:hypothetical protein
MLRCLRIGQVTAALLLLMTSATSDAAQVTVTQVDRKADGTVTDHFSVRSAKPRPWSRAMVMRSLPTSSQSTISTGWLMDR